MKKVTFMMLALLSFVVTFAAGQKQFISADRALLTKGQVLSEQRINANQTIKALDRKSQTARKAARRAAADELVTPPENATVETWYTVGGAFYVNTASGWSNATTKMETVQVAIDGTDIYIQGLAYWFKDAWVKGTIEGETATFASGQLFGTDEYGDEFFVGSDDGGETVSDVVFAYDSEEGTLSATTTYIFESGAADDVSAYTYWYQPVFSKEAPEAPEAVVLPEGVELVEYAMSYTDYDGNAASGAAAIGIDGNDVYMKGFSSYIPDALIKGTKDGNTITFPANQYLGTYSGYDSFFKVEAVFTYDEATDSYSAEGAVYSLLNDYYIDVYANNPVLKPVVEKAATPANPEITALTNGNYGWYITFNVPLTDTEGNGLVASKLSYMIYTDVEGEISPLTFTPETHTKLTEDMTEIPYGFTENWDFYNTQIYLNDLYSKNWNNIGIQSIYSGGGEANATEIQWFAIKPYSGPSVADDPDFVWVAGEQGYENAQDITEFTIGEGVTATLDQGTNTSNAPKYYTSNQTLRIYAGNTLTITSAENAIGKIEVTFPMSAKAAEIELEADKGTYALNGNVGTWTGNDNEITFTAPTGKKAFIAEIAVYFSLAPQEDVLVELPEGAEPEVWTIEGTFKDSYSADNIQRESEVAIVGNDIYVKGIPFYFEESWMKGTIDTETGVATFASGQFVGEDEYGTEYMLGSDDAQTICDIEFVFNAEEKTLTQLTSYIIENGDSRDEIQAYGYWYDMFIYAGEPVVLDPVEAPEGLETDPYLFTANCIENTEGTGEEEPSIEEYSAQLQVGFDGQDVYFQGFAGDAPTLWVKGTLSEDGKTVTIPANQFMGNLSYLWFSYDYFFTAVDPETGELNDIVLNYNAEDNTFTTDQLLALNGNKRSLYYYQLFTDVNITKINEVAATPADPEIVDFVGTGSYPKVYFNIPAVDTEGNALITAKLFYTVWVEKNGEAEELTIKADEYRDVEEDMVEIPYNYDDSWDIYAGGEVFYLNQSSDEIQSWTKIGVQSIYTGAGETNKSNVVWKDLTEYWIAVGIAEAKADNSKQAVIYNLQGQKLNSKPAAGLYIMNGKKYVVK